MQLIKAIAFFLLSITSGTRAVCIIYAGEYDFRSITYSFAEHPGSFVLAVGLLFLFCGGFLLLSIDAWRSR